MSWKAAPTGKRGRQPDYSNAATRSCLTMKMLFGMILGNQREWNKSSNPIYDSKHDPFIAAERAFSFLSYAASLMRLFAPTAFMRQRITSSVTIHSFDRENRECWRV